MWIFNTDNLAAGNAVRQWLLIAVSHVILYCEKISLSEPTPNQCFYKSKKSILVWDCECDQWVNEWIGLINQTTHMHASFHTVHKTTWLVRICLCKLVGICINLIIWYFVKSESVASMNNARRMLVQFMYNEHSPQKKTAKTSKVLSLWMRSQMFAALVSKWCWEVLVDKIMS